MARILACMRFLLGWGFKFGLLGVAYLALTGGLSLKLPQTVMGYEVPREAHQWAERANGLGELTDKAQAGVKTAVDRLK